MAVFDDTYTGQRWAYGLTHRPPGYAHNPDGWIVDSIRPSPCPCALFGTIEYPRALTEREIASYELIPMAGHRCPEYCDRCSSSKDFDQKCPGNDDCTGQAYACEGWGGYCCRCGASFAYGQI